MRLLVLLVLELVTSIIVVLGLLCTGVGIGISPEGGDTCRATHTVMCIGGKRLRRRHSIRCGPEWVLGWRRHSGTRVHRGGLLHGGAHRSSRGVRIRLLLLRRRPRSLWYNCRWGKVHRGLTSRWIRTWSVNKVL